jgi:hypothetical protein
VRPVAHHLDERRLRVRRADFAAEQGGLVALVDDDPVTAAPPDLQRNAASGKAPRQVERTADRVLAWICRRRPADLGTDQPLQTPASPQEIEFAVAEREVRRCVEGRRAGEQVGMAGGQ